MQVTAIPSHCKLQAARCGGANQEFGWRVRCAARSVVGCYGALHAPIGIHRLILLLKSLLSRWEFNCRSLVRRSLGPLFGLLVIAEDLFPDDACGGLAQVVVERFRKLLEFGPQSLVDEGLGCTQHDGRIPLARITIRLEPVAAAKCQEKAFFPGVRQVEIQLNNPVRFFRSAQRCTNAVKRRSCGVALTSGRCPLEECCNFAQLLAKFLFSGQPSSSRPLRSLEEERPSSISV